MANRTLPLVSVIIPTYNSGGTIEQSIRSILNQSYRNFEIVVVDGGSTDNTLESVEHLGTHPVAGAYRRSSARRMGANTARGDFLLFIDSDQVAAPDLIAACVEATNAQPGSAVWIPEEDRGSGIWFKCYSLERKLATAALLVYPRFYKRADYLAIGGHSTTVQDFMEDRELFLRWIRTGRTIAAARSRLFNDLGHLNPITQGRKGAAAADDALEYYFSEAVAQEGPQAVIVPRLVALIRSDVITPKDLASLLFFPVYLIVVRGPRMSLAFLGLVRARVARRNPR